jgi:hypothetical protein
MYNNRYGTSIKRAAKSRSKEIMQFSKDGKFIRLWNSAKEASEKLGINHSNIIQCCKKKSHYHSAGGYAWKYHERGA